MAAQGSDLAMAWMELAPTRAKPVKATRDFKDNTIK